MPVSAKHHLCSTDGLNRHVARPVGHVPHGFYEKEMKGFFSQFGEIKRLRLARNKKSGNSRSFAFIEFEDERVAAIVSETMDNYLLCNKLLVCKVVPAEKVHAKTFDGANRKFRQIPWRSIERDRHNADRSTVQQQTRTDRLMKRENKKRKQLEALGIEYDFPGYSATVSKKPTKTTFD
jgi:nucleolar protein 15